MNYIKVIGLSTFEADVAVNCKGRNKSVILRHQNILPWVSSSNNSLSMSQPTQNWNLKFLSQCSSYTVNECFE